MVLKWCRGEKIEHFDISKMKEAESPALFDKALKISFSSFDVEDPFRDGFPPLSSLRDGGFSRWRRNVPGTEYMVYGVHLFMTFRWEET